MYSCALRGYGIATEPTHVVAVGYHTSPQNLNYTSGIQQQQRYHIETAKTLIGQLWLLVFFLLHVSDDSGVCGQ